MKLKQTNASA